MTAGFEPVRTLADLDSLDLDEIVAGYQSADRDDPEPGANRGRAFWHGWRCRMMDHGKIPVDEGHALLTVQLVARNARERAEARKK